MVVPLPKRANTHYHGIWAPGAKDRDLVVPALGDRVAHNKRKHGAKCAAGEHEHDADCGHAGHGHAGAAMGADGGGNSLPATGIAADAAPSALGQPAANDGGSKAEAAADTSAPAGAAATSPRPATEAEVGEDSAATAKAASTKLTWAEALKRAFGWDLLKCPHCGGRRKMIAAIRSPPQVEKILRHVGEWREAGDRGGDDVIAIRGPPGTFDDDVDDAPGEKFDGVDDPVGLDWTA